MDTVARILHALPPEAAHRVALWGMKRRLMAPGRWRINGESLFGTAIDNRVGLAAGFDKNGHLINTAREYGFGWVEVGSVTRRGGPGNPKPRLWRTAAGGLANRMGLNGDPAALVVRRIEHAPTSAFAVNVAKTNDPTVTGAAAVQDVVDAYARACPFGIYTALNVSCPNTADRSFADPPALRDLLRALRDVRRHNFARPLVVKFGPFPDPLALHRAVAVCLDEDVDGFITANTTPVLHAGGPAGLSGPSLRDGNLRQLADIVKYGKPVIACGGVERAEDARRYLEAGAAAVQAYAGFVNGPHAGPCFAWRLNDELSGFPR